MADEDDDPVVLELPVFVCSGFHGSTTHLALLHNPLRPPWRPYEYSKVQQMRMKPGARKMEVELPVDAQSKNYNDCIEEFKQIKKVTLRSTLVEAATSLAVGTVKDGKFLLMPVDYSLQLRPTLSHLNIGNASKRGKEEADDDSDDEPTMRAVEVQVQKRETERQQQARLNSYAYLSQKEEEEPWTNLTLHLAESKPAESVWARFSTTNETQMSADMSRSAYLRSFVPSLADGEGDREPSGDTALADVPRPSAAAPALSSSQTLALAASMRSLFSKHPVCTLLNIRQWLQDPAQASLAKEVALSADRPLHDALMATGLLVCIRRTYLLIATENALTDPFRAVLLDLLKEKETFKRAEVLDAAQQRNITVSDSVYNKVVKECCQSRGYQWLLKAGAQM